MRRQLIIIGLTSLACAGLIRALHPIDVETAALYPAVLGLLAFGLALGLHAVKGRQE